MEEKSIREIMFVIFRAVTLAMGVAVVVLSCMGSLAPETAVLLLGIGLSLGMLLGLAVGSSIKKEKHGEDHEKKS